MITRCSTSTAVNVEYLPSQAISTKNNRAHRLRKKHAYILSLSFYFLRNYVKRNCYETKSKLLAIGATDINAEAIDEKAFYVIQISRRKSGERQFFVGQTCEFLSRLLRS